MEHWITHFHARLDSWGERLHQKEIRIPINLTAGIVSMIFAVCILVIMPQQVAISEKDVVNGRAFPTLLMGIMLLCSAALVLKDLFKIAKKEPLELKTINLLTEVKALIIFGILLITYLLSKMTGLFVIGGIFCCLGFLVYFRCRKRSYYAITLILAVGIWAAFRFVLGVEF